MAYTLEKIKSIINSCITYEQTQSCLNIVKLVKREHSFKVLGMVQDKVYSIRNTDLKEHYYQMEILREKRRKIFNGK